MKMRRKGRLRDALGKYRAKVTVEDFQNIREDYAMGRTLKELGETYPNYSRSTVRRIIGRDRGRVLVRGLGLVDSAKPT